jgi:phosphoribosyl-AMP cyclohydrolase
MKRPDFAKCGGLVPAIAQEACSGEVLMLAYMNEEAYDKTLATGEVHYFSRSRQKIWHKGGTNDGERTCSPKVFDPKEVYK